MEEIYERERTPNLLLRRQRELRGWSQGQVAKELQALFPGIAVTARHVARWESGKRRPGPYYREKLCTLFQTTADKLGFIPQDVSFEHNGEKGETVQEGERIDVQTHHKAECKPTKSINHLPELVASPRLSLVSSSQDIVPTQENSSEQEQTLGQATTLLTPSHGQLFFLWERLSRALAKPSSIDETTLQFLEMHTEQYWQARQRAAAASCDVLSYVRDHLQKVTLLLEGSLLPTIRMRLCSIASKTAQLVGELLLDMGNYEQGKQFHEASITAAQEACNQTLEAVAWGRTSLAWIYCNSVQDAWNCIQEAIHLVGETSTPISAWLAAIEAEVEARRFDSVACFRALKDAEKIEGQCTSIGDMYMIRFDTSLLRGYQGVCFRRLYHSEDPQRTTFLSEAQRVLMEALASLDPTVIQRQPTFLTDLADTYIQQGEIEEACKRSIQAIKMATQIKLQKVVLRLLKLRQQLEPWKDTQYVQTLDSFLAPLQRPKAKY
jgi:transcriptional regulator with XRE-family HTH domain